jgi:SAM-dependent methyltransferase
MRLPLRNRGLGDLRRLVRRWQAPAETYNDHHAGVAALAANGVEGKHVLVVGCNTGGDCRLFVNRGAKRVHGIDVIPDVGAEFQHRRVSYSRMSAEEMELPSGSFDLVFCFATMEHVSRIDLAFPELVRVARPGGVVYSVAAPLWNSPYGHHKGDLFADVPWIHLCLDKGEILDYSRERGIAEHHVVYMLDPANFNMLPARSYVEACGGLDGIEVIANDLANDDETLLTDEILAELAPRGYTREELLAYVHTFIARKL